MPDPHHALSNPAGHPDETAWPDPYDKRPDPLGPGAGDRSGGAMSTSSPHPTQDRAAGRVKVGKGPPSGRSRKGVSSQTG